MGKEVQVANDMVCLAHPLQHFFSNALDAHRIQGPAFFRHQDQVFQQACIFIDDGKPVLDFMGNRRGYFSEKFRSRRAHGVMIVIHIVSSIG